MIAEILVYLARDGTWTARVRWGDQTAREPGFSTTAAAGYWAAGLPSARAAEEARRAWVDNMARSAVVLVRAPFRVLHLPRGASKVSLCGVRGSRVTLDNAARLATCGNCLRVMRGG